MIGGGNTAVEEALYLSNIASKVTWSTAATSCAPKRSCRTSCSPRPQAGKIELIWDHARRRSARRRQRRHRHAHPSDHDEAPREIAVQGFFVAIGHTPNTSLFEGQLDMATATSRISAGPGRQCHRDLGPGRVRRGRRRRPGLPPGDHLGRLRLHGRARRREVPRQGALRRGAGRAPMALRLVHSLDAVPRGRIGMRCTTARNPFVATPSCRAGAARLPADRLGLDAAPRRAVRRRPLVAAAPGLPEGQLARRVRVRPRLGPCLRAATGSTTTRNGCRPCPTRPCTGPRLLARDAGAAPRWPRRLRERTRRAAACPRCTSTSSTESAAGRRSTPAGWPAPTCSSTGATTGLARFRRLPRRARPAASARPSAPSARRSRAPASRSARCTATRPARTTSPRCTRSTCTTQSDKGNRPALTLEFFRHLAAAMPRALLLVLAEREGEPIAGALFLRGGDTLYGRYWGATRSAAGPALRDLLLPGHRLLPARRPAPASSPARRASTSSRAASCPSSPTAGTTSPTALRRRVAPWCAQERQSVLRYRDQPSPTPRSASDDADPAPRG